MSLRSMTGYAAATARRGASEPAVTVTLKSVNHRFLDLHLRMPPELEPLEPRLRRAIRERISRGHLDVIVQLERTGGVAARIDQGLVSAYIQAYDGLRREFGLTIEPDLNAVLKIPGAISYAPADLSTEDVAALESLLFQALGEAMEQLDGMRIEEARNIAGEMETRLEQVFCAAGEIETLRAGAEAFYHQRLRERIAELLGATLPPERLAQEAALLVERSDVSEEVTRLKSHVAQFRRMMSAAGSDGAGESGKRLDFLLQEMGRESNTILSKTSGLGEAGLRITEQGLALKAEIEKLREQVQNLQ